MNEVKNSLETGTCLFKSFGSFIVKTELKTGRNISKNTIMEFLHITFLHSNLQSFC
jgi:hypothetical protein